MLKVLQALGHLETTTLVADWQYVTSLPAAEASFWLAVLSGFLLVLWLKRPYRFPPGPLFLPVYGSWRFVTFGRGVLPNVLSVFSTLRDKYGGIFSVGWFNRKVVVLADYSSMREALIKHGQDFAGRPHTGNLEPAQCGLVQSPYTEGWKQQRHAFMSALRELSTTRGRTETALTQEINHLTHHIHSQQHAPFNPRDGILNALINVFSAVIFGERFDYDTEEFSEMRRVIEERLKSSSPDGSTGSLQCWLPSVKRQSKIGLIREENLTNYVKKRIKSHKISKINQDHDKDFISAYENIVTSRQIVSRLLRLVRDDILVAGLEPMVTALTWALYYLAAHPEVQQRAYSDVLELVGQDRHITLQDRDRLPYLDAVVMETLRLSGTLPLATPHVTRCDTEVRGFRIPRGMLVCPFLWSVLRDPTRWPEPEVFNPERHLNDSGRVQNREGYVPFGIGRRACPGEQFASNQLFLFVTSLIRDFQIQAPPSVPQAAGTLSSTLTPPPFVISFHTRSQQT